MRRAISTSEEVWVRACYKFFEEFGFWYWYEVPKEKAFAVIMMNTKGAGNPEIIKQRVEQLYKDVEV